MSATDVLLGQSRGLRVALGVVTVVAGALILAWPGGTLLAVAVLLGIQLIVAGIVRAVTAFTFDADSVAGRILFLLLGVLLVVVGILCLRAPLRTIAILVLLFGLSTIVSGALEFFHGVTGGGGWAIASGIVSILIGIIVLSYPVSSVSTMVWLFGLSLLVVGLTGIASAFTPSRSRVSSHTTAPPAATATP
jgi:uncharacterized membrane protein HdeD (DUF308 family)